MKNTLIKGFKLKKKYPNKLKIKIFEKKPFVILFDKKKKFYLSETIDLIKIDTNGFELNVIRGLINIIKKDKPTLIVEINKDHRKISSLLRKLKYTDYYYSIKKRKFSRRMDINCTNKYFLQNKKLKN